MNESTINNCLVIGAGTMGEGIAQQFAQAGKQVNQIDINQEVVNRCREQIKLNLTQLERNDLLSESPETICSRIVFKHLDNQADLVKLANQADFVIEVIPEILQLKQELFAILDQCRKEIILASNTSTLSISDIAAGMTTSERVIGVHFFYPAHIVPLVEVHRGRNTSDSTVAITNQILSEAGKSPINIKKVLPGFIVNRMQAAFNREVVYMLEQGVASAEELDMAAKACFGFRLACLGPLEIHDLNGLDVVMNSWKQTRPSLCNDVAPAQSVAEKVESGDLGVKTGKGWHEYGGKSREEILSQSNDKLLQQLKLFQSRQEPSE